VVATLRASVLITARRIAVWPIFFGHIDEWHLDLAVFFILGKLGSYRASPL
jgi:hypothetical protein